MNAQHNTLPGTPDPSLAERPTPRSGPLMTAGIILAVLGALAVAMPLLSTLAVELLIGSLIMAGGLLRIISLLQDKHWPGYRWSMVSAVLVTVLGVVLLAFPLQGSISLTMVLSVVFLIEGVSAILVALNFRQHSSGWLWILFNGLVNLFLVFIIWQSWPVAGTWLIGTLTGINLLFMGLSFIMVAGALRRAAN